MSIQRILIFRAGAVGDFIVSLPAIAALRAAFPSASIDLVGYPERAVFAQPKVNRIHDVDSAQWSALFARDTDLTLLDPILADTDLVLAYMNDPDGVVNENFGRLGVKRTLFHPPRPPEDEHTHAVDHLLDPIRSLNLNIPHTTPSIVPDEDATHAVRSIRKELAIDGPHAVFHAGAGGSHKLWPSRSFVDIAERLWVEREWPVIVTGGPADGDLATTISREADAPVFPLDPIDLPMLAALYAECDLYLGCDTGPSHLAAATGAPTVVMFGPTRPEVWAPRGSCVRVVTAPDDTMAALSPESVYVDIQAILGTSGNS